MERSKQEIITAILANLEMAYRAAFDKASKLEAQGDRLNSGIALGKADGFLECIKLITSESRF